MSLSNCLLNVIIVPAVLILGDFPYCQVDVSVMTVLLCLDGSQLWCTWPHLGRCLCFQSLLGIVRSELMGCTLLWWHGCREKSRCIIYSAFPTYQMKQICHPITACGLLLLKIKAEHQIRIELRLAVMASTVELLMKTNSEFVLEDTLEWWHVSGVSKVYWQSRNFVLKYYASIFRPARIWWQNLTGNI